MNRIELYVDRENRLTLEFFYKQNDDNSMYLTKGEKCYPIISKMCETQLVNVKENSQTKELSLVFDNCIFNISEYDKVLNKRGTGPLKIKLTKYYESNKKETIQPKKVKRVNQYIGREIIAGALVLSLLATMVGVDFWRKKKKDNNDDSTKPTYTEETTSPTEYKLPIEDEFTIGETSSEKKEDKITIENLYNKDESLNKTIYIPFQDRSNTEKARITRAYYGETIERYAKRYGVDPKIMIAIATQERGIHSDEMDRGGATGLMQIQNAVWLGESVTAYNHDTQKYETLLIDKSKLSDVFYNIRIGCMYFQNCMNYMNGNILAAIQCYNYGLGNMEKVFKQYSFESGKGIKEILADISDCGWMDFRFEAVGNVGDKDYVENVISWMGSTVKFENQDSTDNSISITITNTNPEKTR